MSCLSSLAKISELETAGSGQRGGAWPDLSPRRGRVCQSAVFRPFKAHAKSPSCGTLESSACRQYLSTMLRRVTHVLIALIIAMAATMPAGVRAMPMPSAVNGMAADQPCPSCPRHPQSGHINPDKMPTCQVLACAGPLAMLPGPVSVREQAFSRVSYLKAPPARWTDAGPAPDPFPPRPIVLL